MRFIGITGGVGAGKSLILDHLKDNYNCKVVLADDLAKNMLVPGTDLFEKLHEAFCDLPVWLEDGSIDRPAMARVIFSDPILLDRMNAIVHPAVKTAVMEDVEMERKRGEIQYFFLEAAVLIEDNYGELCDEVWYIYTSEENRRARLKSARGYSDERITEMFKSQLDDAGYRAGSDFVIDNNGTPEEAARQIDERLNGTF